MTMTDSVVALVVGVILLSVVAAVILTQNAETLGGSLNFIIVGFITTGLAIALLVKAFGIVKS